MGFFDEALENLKQRMFGPGHHGKAELVEQDVYEWPFVTLTRQGKNSWTITIYLEPGSPRGPVVHQYSFSFTSTKDAINRAADENREAAERWVARRRRERQQHHDERVPNFRSGHQGAKVQECPACQEELEQQRRERRRKSQ